MVAERVSVSVSVAERVSVSVSVLVSVAVSVSALARAVVYTPHVLIDPIRAPTPTPPRRLIGWLLRLKGNRTNYA